MISGENIQPYINFLHDKRYGSPASDELLDRWKSLNDFEIIKQLQGLYNFWEIDSLTADMYERLFFQSQTLQAPVPEPQQEFHREEKKATPFKYGWIILTGIAIIAVGIWWLNRSGNLSETNADLKKKAQQLQDSVSMEQAISQQREREAQRKAAERAAMLQEVRTNTSRYVSQKVTYDYDGFFGGIDQVTVSISNNTDFNISEATIVLSYIKKNGELYDTKYVTASGIAAHSQKMINGPDSKRGTRLDSRLGKVVFDPGTSSAEDTAQAFQ